MDGALAMQFRGVDGGLEVENDRSRRKTERFVAADER
jgi:hypothetical protein